MGFYILFASLIGVMRAVFRPAQCSHRGYASMFSTVSALSWGLCEHFSALRGAPCGVHGGHFCPARCSMWGTWRAFLPCAVLHVGYMERFSGRRGAPCGVYGGHFRPARCSHRGYVSTFPGGALPEWSQAEGAPSCDVTHYPYICLLLLPLLCLTRVRLCCGDGIHY